MLPPALPLAQLPAATAQLLAAAAAAAAARTTVRSAPAAAMSDLLEQATAYARDNPGVVAGACLAVLLIGITQIVLTTGGLRPGGGGGGGSSGSGGALHPTDFTPFALVEKRAVSHNTRLFRFALPGGPDATLGLPLGRHVSLRADVAGREVRRPYTPVSPVDARGHFDLLVKVYPAPHGLMSRHLDALRLGDPVDVRGPLGRFTYSPAAQARLLMVCGGTGITPMWQLVSAVLADPADRNVIRLVFANVSEDDILMRDELDDLARAHPARFSVFYVVNEAPKDKPWDGGVGFVTHDILLKQFGKAEDGDDALALMCGPPPMNRAMKKILDDLGYPESKIFKF